MRGRLPSSTKKLLASKPKLAADHGRDQQFDHQRQHRALGAADGADGQHRTGQRRLRVGGRPALRRPAPSPRGSACRAWPPPSPCRARLRRLRSIIKGSVLRRGNTAATGLVPKMACRPPAAGIAAGELAKPRPTMPAAATGRRWSTTTPQWWLATTPAKATPCVRAAATASATASAQAGKARPSRHRPGSRRRAGAAPGHRLAIDTAVAQMGGVLRHARQSVRPQALASASTRACAVLAAIASEAPPCAARPPRG
jgi:hypothetical protein